MKRLIWISSFSYLLIGLAHVIIGSIMPVLLDHYHVNYSAGGNLIFAQFTGFLVGVLVSPWLIGKLGKRNSLVLAVGVLALAELAYTFLPPWNLMYLIGACAGFGFGMVEAIIGTLIIAAAADNAAVEMSRLEVFFGIGALVMPLVSGWLIESGAWRFGFLLISIISLVMMNFWVKSRFGALDPVLSERGATGKWKEHKKEKGKERGEEGNRGSAGHPAASVSKKGWSVLYQGAQRFLLAVFVLYFFVYVGTEMSFVNFMPSLMIEKSGATEAVASFSVTLFWLAMSIGRMYGGILAKKIGYARYIVSGITVALLFMALFNFTSSRTVLFLFIIVIGLFMSGLFSISLVYATSLLSGSEETTPSLLIASGGIGGAVLPLLVGHSMDSFGAQTSGWLLTAVLGLLLVLGAAAILIEWSRRANAAKSGAAAQAAQTGQSAQAAPTAQSSQAHASQTAKSGTPR